MIIAWYSKDTSMIQDGTGPHEVVHFSVDASAAPRILVFHLDAQQLFQTPLTSPNK